MVSSQIHREAGAENIIIVVFDADSRIPSDFLERVTPYFSDPAVVGVQSAVRMSNANRNWLTFWQNIEFVVWARIFSRAKDRLGSATLGGNGQCVRLSALMSLGEAPWRPSLTEDLDLSLRLIVNGGRIRFCGETFVSQEAIPRVLQLVRQRSRWIQGHLVTWEHLPAILKSRAPLRVRLDLAILLILPAGLVPLALATVDGWRTFLTSLGSLSLQPLLAWYLLAFASAPLTIWALLREGETDRRRAIVHAHLFLGYTTFWLAAAGRAVWSILRGDRSWAKTSRSPQSLPALPAADAASPDPDRDIVTARPSSWGWGSRRFAGVAILALIASTSLVLIAAALLLRSYGDVTAPGVGEFSGGVSGITGRPPSMPVVPGQPNAVRLPSPVPAASGASVDQAPATVTSPAPSATRRPTPPAPRIEDQFPELSRCPGVSDCYVYVVQRGDNFFSIVRYYRVDYDTAVRMNAWLSHVAVIRSGDRIRIPTPRRR